jgi:hypothetical protein
MQTWWFARWRDKRRQSPRQSRGARALNFQTKPKAAHIFARAEHEFYVEPTWCDEALFAAETFSGPIHDPACGTGRIVEVAITAGHAATGSDIVERSDLRDFEFDYLGDTAALAYPNIVCNPPYRRAREFITKALRESLQYGFLFGAERAAWLASTPLERVWVLAPRPSMPPGELVLAGLIMSGQFGSATMPARRSWGG